MGKLLKSIAVVLITFIISYLVVEYAPFFYLWFWVLFFFAAALCLLFIMFDSSITLDQKKIYCYSLILITIGIKLSALGFRSLSYTSSEIISTHNFKIRINNNNANSFLGNPSGTLTIKTDSHVLVLKNVNTLALFDSLPDKFRNKKVYLKYIAKGFLPLDTNIIIRNKNSYTFSIFRDDYYSKIKGFIYDEFGNPLEGVNVSIPCCAVSTDSLGTFLIEIPLENQRKEQQICLYKDGFVTKKTTTRVEPNELFIEYLSR
ncbi:MAG: hypothetical protein ACKVTZ_00325 [Bacteroidia bacterium]